MAAFLGLVSAQQVQVQKFYSSSDLHTVVLLHELNLS